MTVTRQLWAIIILAALLTVAQCVTYATRPC